MIPFVVFILFFYCRSFFLLMRCYPHLIIGMDTISTCGFHFWNPALEFASSFIIIPKPNDVMKGTFTPQEQQQLNSTGMCDDSVVVRNSTTKESVANREEQQERRILIVDDEPDITFTLRTILEESGYKEVDVYNEPLLALQDFKSGVYSLLITDIAMPRMDGFELYKQIKNIDTRIKVVFMTASRINYEALNYLTLLPIDRFDTSDQKDKVARGSGEGSEDRIHFIRKPVEIKEFIQRVTKELEEGILGIEKTRCYNEIEFKQTRQQQY